MSYAARMKLAKQTIDKLVKQVGAVSANRGTALIADVLGITDHSSSIANIYALQTSSADWGTATDPAPQFIAMTVDTKHGNCDMKAELTYQSIRNMATIAAIAVNTKICRVFIPGHAFCILCDLNGPGVQVPAMQNTAAQFGNNAVVVDLWQEDYWAPNTWGVRGMVPGPERALWRYRIKNNPITVIRTYNFAL